MRLSVIPGRKEECPVLLYDGVFYTICSAETLEQAGHLAADNMLEFLKKRVDMDPDEAGDADVAGVRSGGQPGGGPAAHRPGGAPKRDFQGFGLLTTRPACGESAGRPIPPAG